MFFVPPPLPPPNNVLFRHVPLLQEKLQTLRAEEGMVSPLIRSGSVGKPGGTPCRRPHLCFHPPTPGNQGVCPKSVWLLLGSVGETQEGMGLGRRAEAEPGPGMGPGGGQAGGGCGCPAVAPFRAQVPLDGQTARPLTCPTHKTQRS